MNEQQLLEALKPLMGILGGESGRLAQLIVWIGAIRVPMKLVSGQLLGWLDRLVLSVMESDEADDDQLLLRLVASWPYRIFALLLDTVLSVKLPTTKSLRAAADAHGVAGIFQAQGRRVPTWVLLGCLGFGLLAAGCAGTPTGLTDQTTNGRPPFVATLAELAAYDGTVIHLGQKPQDRVKFEETVAALDALAANGDFDPLSFVLVMKRLGVKELGGKEAQLIIANVVFLYETQIGQMTPVEQPAFVKEMAARIRSGIARGLEFTKQRAWKPRYHWSWYHRNV